MNVTPEFYTQRIEQAESEAREATLDNVRARALRSAESWKTLGDQAAKIAASRAKAQSERDRLEAQAAIEAVAD
jgi:hypothetical protein